VDGKTSTFTEVGQLLRKRGIDLDNNRFLILQGEVEQIAMMPPKAKTEHDEGLLEFLEDIIGSNKHLEAITESEKALEGLNEARGDKLARLKVTESERDNLEGAKKEAEESVRKGREVRSKQNILYQRHAADAAKHAEEAGAKHAEIEEKREHENAKLEEKNKVVAEKEAEGTSIGADHEAIRKELEKTKKEFTAFERQDIKLREDIKSHKAAKKKLEAAKKKEVEKEAAAKATAEELEGSLPGLQVAVEKAAAKRAEKEGELDQLLEMVKGETEAIRAEVEEKTAAIAPVKHVMAEVEASIGTTETEISLVKEAATSAQKEMAHCEAELARITKDAATKKGAVEGAKLEIKTKEVRLAEVGKELAAAEVSQAVLSASMTAAVARAEEAKAALGSQGAMGRGVVGQLMAAAKVGKPLAEAGVVGRLGDLGAIDSKFDVAISTACGYLDYAVVETAAGGQKCIEYLKKHNLGRMSFIVLDQIRDRYERALGQPFHVPASSKRLFDLVEPANDGLRCAFYFALRNTLVTSDLDTAVGFAYDGNRPVHRVVTMNGDVIDTTGTLSGGGKTVRRGGMLFTGSAAAKAVASSSADDEVTVAQVAALENEAVACTQALAKCRSTMDALKREGKALEEALKKLRKSLPKLEMAIVAAEKSLPDLAARAEVLRPRCGISKADAARIKELEASVAKARKDSAGTKKKYDTLQKEIDMLQAKILAAGGEPVKKQRAAVAKATAAHDEAESAVAQAGVDLKDCHKAAEKAAKAAARAEADLAVLEKKHGDVMEEFTALEAKALTVMDAFNTAQAEAKKMEKKAAAAAKELDALQKEVAKIAAVEVDIVNQADEYSEVLKDNQRKEMHWREKVQELQEAHLTDFKEWGALSSQEGEDADTDAGKGEGETAKKKATDEERAAAAEGAVATPKTQGSKKIGADTAAAPEPLKSFTAEQLAQYDIEDLKYEIALLEEARDQLSSSVNMTAIAEYKKKQAEYLGRFVELEASTEERDAARATFEDLRRKRLDDFMVGFGLITLKLKEMYQMITLGGDAELELVDSLDPFSEGIVFSVRPPKKSWKNIANLSGGEKTLSSLALVFALHHYKPTPLYVMDEIDAALDFKNVSIVANYIKERTKNAQFVIISLRNNMFELADRLVGIYKTNDTTKSVTINPKVFGELSTGIREPAATEKLNPLIDRTNTAASPAVVH
jgi:structural maintenance of chromosome 4